MYILFECSCTDVGSRDSFRHMDAMGYSTSEKYAMLWRDQNPEYRDYKYCTDKEWSEVEISGMNGSEVMMWLYEMSERLRAGNSITASDSDLYIRVLDKARNIIKNAVGDE